MDDSISQKLFNEFMDSLIKDLIDNDRYGKIMIYTTTQDTVYDYIKKYPNIITLDTFENPRTNRILAGFEIDIEIPKPKKLILEYSEGDTDFREIF